MKVIRTSTNLDEVKFDDAQVFDLELQPSLTDPSQALEPADIIAMYTRGEQIRILRGQKYGEPGTEEGELTNTIFDPIVQNLHNLDKPDRAQASLDIREIINGKAKSIDETSKKVANAKLEKQIQDKIAKERKDKEDRLKKTSKKDED